MLEKQHFKKRSEAFGIIRKQMAESFGSRGMRKGTKRIRRIFAYKYLEITQKTRIFARRNKKISDMEATLNLNIPVSVPNGYPLETLKKQVTEYVKSLVGKALPVAKEDLSSKMLLFSRTI